MQLLVYLAERPGEVASADELLDKLWTGKVVTGASVYNCIAELRHALATGDDDSHYVQTIPKKGYRLVAPVAGCDPGNPCPSDGAGIPGSGRGMAVRFTTVVVVVLAVALLAIDRFAVEEPAGHAVPGSPKPSIVVLPFSDLSPEKENAYFCDGITEELVNGLAQLEALRVVSHASSKAMADAGLSTPELAQKLGVSHVLEGSVRKAGARIRITAQLIDARNDAHLWSHTYDRRLADIFAIQDEISARVLDELRIWLLEPLRDARTTNARVFELYLRGRYLVTKRSDDALSEAVSLFERASEIDPEYAPVQAGLAKALYLISGAGHPDVTDDIRRRARAAVNRALETDPRNPDALAVKGLMLAGEDMGAARSYLQLAIASSPSNSDARRWLALTFSETDPARYLDVMLEAYLVDPLLPPLNLHRVDALARLGRQSEALVAVREWRDLYPGHPGPYAAAGNLHARAGNVDMALRSYYLAYLQAPGEGLIGDLPWLLLAIDETELAAAWAGEGINRRPGEYLVPRMLAAARLGRRDEALQRLADIERHRPGSWADVGRAYVILGEFDRARDAWERGLRNPGMDILGNVFENWGVYRAVHYALALQRTGASRRASALIDDALTLVEKQIDSGMEYYGLWSGTPASPLFHAAALTAMGGRPQDSLRYLQRDASGDTVSCPACLRAWPHFDSLRDNPAFIEFLAEQAAMNEIRRRRYIEDDLLLTPAQVASARHFREEYFADL